MISLITSSTTDQGISIMTIHFSLCNYLSNMYIYFNVRTYELSVNHKMANVKPKKHTIFADINHTVKLNLYYEVTLGTD
jgi:hypothetical protein